MENAAYSGQWTRLRPPRGMTARMKKTARALANVPREEWTPAGAWLCDHGQFLMGEMEALKREVKHAPPLPGWRGTPRVLALARQIVQTGEGQIASPLILRAARAFWEGEEPEQKELHLLPCALKLALLEELDACGIRCLQEARDRARGRRWAKRFSARGTALLPRRDAVLEAGVAFLTDREDEAALRRADALLSRQNRRLPDRREEQTAQGLLAGRLIASLRQLPRLPFDRIIERLNPVAAVLRQEDTYCRMDDAGRACYQQRVTRIAKRYAVSEGAVARAALALKEDRDGAAGQAGYYLLERPDLIGEYLLRRPARFSMGRRGALFALPLYAGAAAALLLCVVLGVPWYAWLPAVLCASEAVRAVYFPLLRRRVPARPVPRLHIRRLTREMRTLVVVPTLLTSPRQAVRAVKQLSVLRCANPDRYLDFMLLADFADSPQETAPEDEEILRAARESVQALNDTQGGGFYYLHRARQWNGEAFTGRERKRGALETLNHLLTDGAARDPMLYASCPPASLRGRYAYVITLDADTFLPPGAALQLVGAMAHPLQKGRVGVIQPRMEGTPDAVVTYAQAWLGGPGGVDLYGGAAQDVYQDLFGRGSFVGKGIYQPEVWLERLGDQLPENTLLSHDLIEGEFVQSALAADIVLYDSTPQTVAGWQKRLHRWTRGDWQLLPFLGRRELPFLSRHKIGDNLRRSLVPIAQTALMLLGAARRMPLLFLLALPWPPRGLLIRLAVLPGKAYTVADAILRALYRQGISHRHMLAWVTAAQAEGGQTPLLCLIAQAAAGAAMALASLLPGGFGPGALVGILWLAGPLLLLWADRPRRRAAPMTAKQRKEMRALAQRTWRFFEDTVGEDTLFLPPDNVQSEPRKGPALRTSPTNVGLYLLSCCAAREMGFLTSAQMSRRIGDTAQSLLRLKTWKGHLYNWYDLHDGAPLPPLFVSTVDSGNLAACLLCCAQICRQRLAEMPADARDLPDQLERLAARMDFSALYDRREQLFFVGYDAQKQRPTPAHYDLMASEARLTSFLAVMTGQVPLKHWLRLNRAVTRCGGGPALLSWGGTLFEYLMPNLLLPLTPGTLLGEGCQNAVRGQMAHRPDRPFGISESGYYAFDADMNYQYRAFGLPALAMTHETAGQVVAPYASLLALPFFPRAAAANALRMERLGWMDDWGLFEAADYAQGRAPRLVRSHMAHHQGMILCALCNALQNDALIRAFMAQPLARAYGYLLLERPPRRADRRAVWPQAKPQAALPGPCRRTPRDGLPVDAHALAAGHMTWVLSARGQGYLAWKDQMITRFDPDAGSLSGIQFYLRDSASGAVLRLNGADDTRFESGAVRFRAALTGVRATLTCCCAPLTAAAVARLTLENPGREPREMEAVTFLEVAQGRQADDQAHPNFRDLSVRVSPWGSQGLVSRRLPRDERDRSPVVCHLAVGDCDALRRQGDRALFLGRMGTYDSPEQMHMPPDRCAYRTGDVTSPCLSLRASILLPPGEKKTVYFITLCRETEAELTEEWTRPGAWQQALPLAYTQDQMTLRALHIQENALHLYQQALGAIVFSGQPHQGRLPATSRQGLWRMGVSGTLPAWMAVISAPDPALIRHALRCHAWMRAQGVITDLIFFCPQETAYRRPVWDAVQHALSVSPSRSLKGETGGVTVFAGSDAEREAAEGMCRLVLRSGKPMKEQLRLLFRPGAAQAVPCALPQPIAPLKWRNENTFGGFTEAGDYAIVRPAPVPWHNLLCNERFGTLVCETGILHSYMENSRLGRVTRWNPDVRRGVPSEEIYLRDETGELYSLTMPTAIHSPGATEYRCLCGGVISSLTVFTHADRPAGVRALTLRSEKGRQVTVYYVVRFALGEDGEAARCRLQGDCVLAEGGDFPGVAWAGMPGARRRVLPSALYHTAALSNEESGGGSVAVMTLPVEIKPRSQEKITMLIGASSSPAQAEEDYAALLQEGSAAMERAVRSLWQRHVGGLTLFAGDQDLERMMNLWLPYQARASRLFARMGPYQAGGAFGFRDQLQDLLILLHTDLARAREHLLLCAAHQFPEGDVQHWWHAPRRGVRTRISDDKLFLPYMLAQYVKITGDESILLARAPYLEGMPLTEGETDRYEQPAVTPWDESLLQHGIRAINSVALGNHGLPLMGGGDWNDGMNRVGGQRGESVWLGFFLAVVLREFAPLCDPETKEKYQALRRSLMDAAESAWTGQWYLRAWYDDGTPLAGPDTHPPRIDLISQAFAVLAGAPRDHGRPALMNALRRLYDREAGLVKLLDPPFTPQEGAGYIGAYLPGVRENGGQYTHAVPWLIMALCRAGEYAWAWEIARNILPIRHADSRDKALRYQGEPYVLAGDVYEGENRGRAGWTWYTGSAAWLYHAVLTVLLGFEKRGGKARLAPCPGSGLEEFTLVYRFGASRYHFTAARDAVFPTLDGEKLTDGWAALIDDGKTHDARFPMK